jgi:hypothetical protein
MKRSLTLAMTAIPPTGAGILRLPVLVIVIIAVVELVALTIPGITQIWLQRQGSREAMRMLQVMGENFIVRIDSDGGLNVQCGSATLGGRADLQELECRTTQPHRHGAEQPELPAEL